MVSHRVIHLAPVRKGLIGIFASNFIQKPKNRLQTGANPSISHEHWRLPVCCTKGFLKETKSQIEQLFE